MVVRGVCRCDVVPQCTDPVPQCQARGAAPGYSNQTHPFKIGSTLCGACPQPINWHGGTSFSDGSAIPDPARLLNRKC